MQQRGTDKGWLELPPNSRSILGTVVGTPTLQPLSYTMQYRESPSTDLLSIVNSHYSTYVPYTINTSLRVLQMERPDQTKPDQTSLVLISSHQPVKKSTAAIVD